MNDLKKDEKTVVVPLDDTKFDKKRYDEHEFVVFNCCGEEKKFDILHSVTRELINRIEVIASMIEAGARYISIIEMTGSEFQKFIKFLQEYSLIDDKIIYDSMVKEYWFPECNLELFCNKYGVDTTKRLKTKTAIYNMGVNIQHFLLTIIKNTLNEIFPFLSSAPIQTKTVRADFYQNRNVKKFRISILKPAEVKEIAPSIAI